MDWTDIHDAQEEASFTRYEHLEYSPEPVQDKLYDIMNEGVEPTYTPTPIRMPDVSEYNALARLWQSEELDGYIEKRKEAFDLIDEHTCQRTTEAIVDGKRMFICKVCSPAYGLLSTVLTVQDTQQELKKVA